MLLKILLPANEILNLFSISYCEIIDTVKIRLGLTSSQGISLKYLDSDQGLVNLNNQEDLKIAILTRQMEQIDTLKVYVSLQDIPRRVERKIEKYQFSSQELAETISNTPILERQAEKSPCTPQNARINFAKQKLTSLRNARKQIAPYKANISSDIEEYAVIKVKSFEEYQVHVTIKNIGRQHWPNGVSLTCINGIHRGISKEIQPLQPGAEQTFELGLVALVEVGQYISQWKLCYNDNHKMNLFGENLFIEIQVEEVKFNIDNNEKRSVNEEEREIGNNDKSFIKRDQLAKYLNNLFPGDIEEKFQFLDNFVMDEHENDMLEMVGYMLIV